MCNTNSMWFKAAKPTSPRNCSLQAGSNSTEGASSWLRVRCVPGYDGGLPQYFMLEALDPVSGKTKFNSSVNETGSLFIILNRRCLI